MLGCQKFDFLISWKIENIWFLTAIEDISLFLSLYKNTFLILKFINANTGDFLFKMNFPDARNAKFDIDVYLC